MQKLLDQIDETSLNLNTIEAGIFRNLSSAAIVGNCLLDVRLRHLSRSFTHHSAAGGVNQLLWIDCRGSERETSIAEEAYMRYRSLMPELSEDPATLRMNGIRDQSPRRTLLTVVNSGGTDTNPVPASLTQVPSLMMSPARRTLLVIFPHQVSWEVPKVGRAGPRKGAITMRLRSRRSPSL